MASAINTEVDEMRSAIFEKTMILSRIETREQWDVFVEKKLGREIISIANEHYENLPLRAKEDGYVVLMETYNKLAAVADKFNDVKVEEKPKEVVCT